MRQKLLSYFNHQIEAFRENLTKVREESGFDAIHDMRVAIKRLRAVFILAEKLQPGFSGEQTEGELRQLFRLSGKMRDAQVQLALLMDYESSMETAFSQYTTYLRNFERKAVKKFNDYVHLKSETDFIRATELMLPDLILKSDNIRIKSALHTLLEELFTAVESLKTDQQHDEHLHEIRRKLKQCNYLLSVFDTEDDAFPRMNKLLKKLEKANELLGKWHDHVIAIGYLSRFLKSKPTGDSGIFRPYLLLLEQITAEKHMLYLKIMGMMEKPIGKLFPGQG
jgi:CHAD domain-containing protein